MPHIDPGFSNSIEIIVFAVIGLLLWFRLGRLEEALLRLAAYRPGPSDRGRQPIQELSTAVHIPSSMLPWERVENEED